MTDIDPIRRHLLRAAGFSIALPAMASMKASPFISAVNAQDRSAASAGAGTQPKRFCCIVFPNGVSLPPENHPAFGQWNWFPHEVGADYRFTKTLQPLAPHRDHLSILSGLSHPAMRDVIAHITADSFLTGADSSRRYTNSISLDQLIANRIGPQTRFPSLVLSSDGGVGAPGRTQTLSFNASGRPIPSLSEPRAIYNRLFGVSKLSKQQQRRAFSRDRSILDHVVEETASTSRHLSAEDRQRFEEYMTSIREIEHRLASADHWLDAQQPQVDESSFELDASPRGDAQSYIRAILDLMVVALQTDSTRAITYQITSEDAKGIGDRFPNSLGLPGHHSLSHGTAKENGYEQWARYDQFLAKQLAYFLERLNRVSDPFSGGSLLESTIVLYGCGTSHTHKAVNYPLVLAGGSAMGLRHGRHRHFDESRHRLCDLFVTLLGRMGIETDRFGDSQGSLSELLS